MGGGSVDTSTGEFNFAVNEAYMIRNGKICEAVKGATLIGKGDEVLLNIDRVGNDLKLSQGVCGSVSGSVPVDVGQPTIRVSEITVGGQAWSAMDPARKTVTVMAVTTVIRVLVEETASATDVREQASLRDRPVMSVVVTVYVKNAMDLARGHASDVTEPARSNVTSVRAPGRKSVRDAMEA